MKATKIIALLLALLTVTVTVSLGIMSILVNATAMGMPRSRRQMLPISPLLLKKLMTERSQTS